MTTCSLPKGAGILSRQNPSSCRHMVLLITLDKCALKFLPKQTAQSTREAVMLVLRPEYNKLGRASPSSSAEMSVTEATRTTDLLRCLAMTDDAAGHMQHSSESDNTAHTQSCTQTYAIFFIAYKLLQLVMMAI